MDNEQLKFVDDVFDELSTLFDKDKNANKHLLGNDPIIKIFDHYSDWLASNLMLSPKVAANLIYKDLIGIGYYQFDNKKLKKGMSFKNKLNFNVIFGTQKEINEAIGILNELETKNPKKYKLMVDILKKIKEMSDNVKTQKNYLSKRNKENISPYNQMPSFGTFKVLLKMDEKELKEYLNKYTKSLSK